MHAESKKKNSTSRTQTYIRRQAPIATLTPATCACMYLWIEGSMSVLARHPSAPQSQCGCGGRLAVLSRNPVGQSVRGHVSLQALKSIFRASAHVLLCVHMCVCLLIRVFVHVCKLLSVRVPVKEKKNRRVGVYVDACVLCVVCMTVAMSLLLQKIV